MLVSYHAGKRIQQRTHMPPAEILELLTHQACVVLGVESEYSYSLFYSQSEELPLIAITANDTLVTVWHDYFTLPHGVEPVTPKNIAKARQLCRGHWFQKCVTAPEAYVREEPAVPMYRAIIAVRDGNEVIFTTEVACLAANVKRKRDKVVRSLGSELFAIEEIVRDHAIHIVKRVTYLIDIIDLMGKLQRSLIVTRADIVELKLSHRA